MGVRSGAGHDENVADLVLLSLPRLTVSPPNGFEMIASFERHDLCVWPEYYLRSLFDPANQVARHALDQTARPDEHVHALCRLRQKHGSLTGCSFLRQPQSLLHRHTTALPQRSQRNRYPRLQSATSLSIAAFDIPPRLQSRQCVPEFEPRSRLRRRTVYGRRQVSCPW